MEISRTLWATLFHISATLVVVHCLKQTEMRVPSFADKGDSVNITCKFDLEGGLLNSVKWYKDLNEFFRYSPGINIQVFSIPGITVDESQSGMNNVALKNLSYLSSGSYRCEVSTDGPQFAIVFSNLNMTVLSYPKHDPVVLGVQTGYIHGDPVSVNCTAAPSNPAPEVHWYINGDKADTWAVGSVPPVYLSHDQTFTKTVSLSFVTEKHHFKGPNSELQLKCRSVVAGLKPRESTVTLQLTTTLTNQKLAQELFNNAVLSQSTSQILLVISALYILL
uniref:Ig-like domain-containing protein n=1 Tax=Clastoptera arizonana TaxID=38151 RepID=A0A1B6DA29_9HEMI